VRSHQWIDQRSLALHQAVAAKLEAQPQLLEVARDNVRRWRRTNSAAALREWWLLLEATPLPALVALLRSPDEDAARLRQSSPFAGLLTPDERQSILSEYESRRA
jgi:predicted NACHT family NTPase